MILPAEAVWTSWGPWSECTVSCGGGTMKRTRLCVPSSDGSTNCQGSSEKTSTCSMAGCPGNHQVHYSYLSLYYQATVQIILMGWGGVGVLMA